VGLRQNYPAPEPSTSAILAWNGPEQYRGIATTAASPRSRARRRTWNRPEQYGGIATLERSSRGSCSPENLGIALISTVGLRRDGVSLAVDEPVVDLGITLISTVELRLLEGQVELGNYQHPRNFPDQYGGIATPGRLRNRRPPTRLG